MFSGFLGLGPERVSYSRRENSKAMARHGVGAGTLKGTSSLFLRLATSSRAVGPPKAVIDKENSGVTEKNLPLK
jgi:hypothetical protein